MPPSPPPSPPPSSPPPQSTTTPTLDGDSGEANIVGGGSGDESMAGIIGGVSAAVAVVLVAGLVWRRRRRQEKQLRLRRAVLEDPMFDGMGAASFIKPGIAGVGSGLLRPPALGTAHFAAKTRPLGKDGEAMRADAGRLILVRHARSSAQRRIGIEQGEARYEAARVQGRRELQATIPAQIAPLVSRLRPGGGGAGGAEAGSPAEEGMSDLKKQARALVARSRLREKERASRGGGADDAAMLDPITGSLQAASVTGVLEPQVGRRAFCGSSPPKDATPGGEVSALHEELLAAKEAKVAAEGSAMGLGIELKNTQRDLETGLPPLQPSAAVTAAARASPAAAYQRSQSMTASRSTGYLETPRSRRASGSGRYDDDLGDIIGDIKRQNSGDLERAAADDLAAVEEEGLLDAVGLEAVPNANGGSKRSVAMRHRGGATPNGRTDWAAMRAANNRAMTSGACGGDDPDVDPLTNALHMATMLGVDLPPPPSPSGDLRALSSSAASAEEKAAAHERVERAREDAERRARVRSGISLKRSTSDFGLVAVVASPPPAAAPPPAAPRGTGEHRVSISMDETSTPRPPPPGPPSSGGGTAATAKTSRRRTFSTGKKSSTREVDITMSSKAEAVTAEAATPTVTSSPSPRPADGEDVEADERV